MAFAGLFFFFQAEDGIRDKLVTGVQTCALPISEMNLPTKEQVRYHGVRWIWVPALALLTYLAFPSSASNVAPLLEPGSVADREVVAPFTFPVNKSDQELAREAEELAGTVKPIYEFQQRALDSATIALHAFFAGIENAADQGGPPAWIRVAEHQGGG